MSNNKYHYVNHGTKNKRESEKRKKERESKPNNKTPFESKRGLIPEHDLATEYQVTWHAVKRYAERIFKMDPRDLDKNKTHGIAKLIRDSLPTHMLNETRYNLVDNYYAVVNGGMVVTVIKVGK